MSARDASWQPPELEQASVSIELKSINASVRVVVPDGQGAGAAQERLRFKAAGETCGEAVISFPAEADSEARDRTKSRLDQDPLVARLSEALAAAERDPSEFGAIYADAIRLATVARMLSIHAWPEPFARPQEAPEDTPCGLSKWRLKRVMSYVAEHIGDKVTLADMAAAARLSRMHFAALFLRATGLRPHEYLLRQRVAAAREQLLSTDRPIVEVALSVGFQTQAHFTTVFKRVTGTTPARWRETRRAETRSFHF